MKKLAKTLAIASTAVLVASSCKFSHLPGHGNVEIKNLQESVINHVSSTLAEGETVEFGSKYNCDDYMQDGEARFAANVTYYIISKDGTKQERTARIVTNEDKDEILDWKDL